MKPYYSDDHVTIYHGDCLDVLPEIGQVHLVLTDPPYSLSVANDHQIGKGTRRLNFFPGDQDWAQMTLGVIERLEVAAGLSPAVYVWCGHRQFGPITEAFEALGFKTRFLVWRKACPVPAPPGVGWDSAAELCVYAFRAGRAWLPPTGTKCPNVIDADSYRHGQPGKVDHPTQKPMATALIPLQFSCPEGGTVLDPFMGSGSTLKAAELEGFDAIGIELSPEYAEIAKWRIGADAPLFREVT